MFKTKNSPEENQLFIECLLYMQGLVLDLSFAPGKIRGNKG